MVEPTTSASTVGCELGSEGCACLDGGLCDPGLLCASKKCVPSVDPSGSASSSTDTTTDTTTEVTTSGSTTMIGDQCDPAEGLVSEKCAALDSRYPYCSNGGICVDCTGLDACGEELPVCDPSSGKCELCVPGDSAACVDQTPVCDGETNSCVPCVAHEECGDAACNLFTGECFDEDSVLWVDSTDPACSSSGGAEDEPLCELEEAIAATGAGKGWTIRLSGGPYTGAFVVPAAHRLAILNPAAENSRVSVMGLSTTEPTFDVEPAATAIFDGLSIIDNDDEMKNTDLHGLLSNNALLWIDRSRISGNAGRGLTANISGVVIRNVIFTENQGGGILAQGAGSLAIENSFVTKNGTVKVMAGAIAVNGGDLDMLYTTVIGNVATIGFATSLTCLGANEAVIRNSVLVGSDSSVDCMDVDLSYSVVDMMAGGTNFQLDPVLVDSYFQADNGVYRALPLTGIEEVASWIPGDPEFDFEGDLRPSEADAPDYPGADVP